MGDILKFSQEGEVKRQAPVNLKWGRYYSPARTEDGEYEERVGCISWEYEKGYKGDFEVDLYRLDLGCSGDSGDDTPGTLALTMKCGVNPQFTHYSVSLFEIHLKEKILETGNYYFTVTALGDNKKDADSVCVRSENWMYVRPKERLPEISGAVWQWPSVRIANPISSPYLRSYALKLYYQPLNEKQAKILFASDRLAMDASGVITCKNVENLAKVKGAGKYYFKICAMSRDISRCDNGKWTEISEAHVKPV